MKFKNRLVFCILLFGLSGCFNLNLDEAAKQTGELSAASLIYYHHNNCWPNSINELKSFCSQNQEECFLLDSHKYSDAKFETLPDGSLKLEFYISEEQNKPINGQKPNITLTLQKPNIQKTSTEINQNSPAQAPNWVFSNKPIKSSEISEEDQAYLSQWLDNRAKPAHDYMLQLFDKHQVVILGEEHNVKEHKDFVIDLIPRLYHEAGVRCIGWEFSWYGLNDRLEELVNAPNYDEEAVLQFARDCNPGWNSKEHWEIIKSVWKLNKSLKPGNEKMHLVGLPDYVDIAKMYTIVKTSPKDSLEFQDMLKETLEADKVMAQHVEEEILQKGLKGFVFVGMGHDWTQYQYPPEVTYGISCKFMGAHLKEKHGNNVFQVRAQASSDPAIINQLMNDKDHISIGFDIQDSPFANILIPVGKGAPDVPWSKLACGYLYIGSRTSFHSNTAIKGFVNEQMFDKYKDYYEVDYSRTFNSAKEVDEYLQQHRWPKPN